MGRLQTLGIPDKFSPKKIAGLRMWLDSSRITDKSDGDAITVWQDLANPGQPFYDSFDRADSSTTLGGEWQVSGGTWGISSNRAVCVSDANGNKAKRDIGLVDGRFAISVVGEYGATNRRLHTLAFRLIDTDNYLRVWPFNGTIRLEKVDSGTSSVLASATTTVTDGVEYRIEVVCSGNSVTVHKDGASLFTHTLAGGDSKYAAANATYAGITMIKAGAPTLAASSNDFVVARLTDAVQTTVAAKPLYKTAQQNGRPVVRFASASSQFLQTAPFAQALAQPNTIFVVAKCTNASGYFVDGLTSGTRHAILKSTSAWLMTAGTNLTGYPADSNTSVHSAVFNGATSAFSLNGSQVLSGNAGAQSLTGLSIGISYLPSVPLNGDTCEILVYNANLTTAQRRRVERYLAKKWGVTLTHQVVEDTFTRPDSATSLGNAETGQAWATNAVWGVTGGQAYVVTSSGNNFATVDTGLADCAVQATITFRANDGIAVRYTDTNNYLVARLNGTELGLFKVVGGAITSLGTYAFTASSGSTYTIRVVMSGTSIKVYLDGTERISVTDSFNSTATRHGFREAAGSPLSRYDNFTVESL